MKLSELLKSKTSFNEPIPDRRQNVQAFRTHNAKKTENARLQALITKVGTVLDAADTLESQDDRTGAYKSNDHQNLKIAIAELRKELTDDQA